MEQIETGNLEAYRQYLLSLKPKQEKPVENIPQTEDQFKARFVKIFNYSPEVKEIIDIEFTGHGKAGGRKGKKSEEVTAEDRERNLKRVKKNVRRMAFANDLGQVHMVLTYKEEKENPDETDIDFKNFIYELRQLYPKLKYIATREIQKKRQNTYGKAVIHYHVLLNQRVDFKKTSEIWGHGFVTLVQHPNKLKAVLYVLKYINKEVGETVMQTSNGHTKKAYLSSQGLKKEVEGCTSSFLINSPESYVEFNDGVNFLMTNLTEGWDLKFDIKASDERTIKGRSLLRCAANNY